MPSRFAFMVSFPPVILLKKRLFLFCLIPVLLLGACRAEQLSETTLFAMDTVMELRVYGDDRQECRRIIQALETELSVTDPDSQLSRLNAAGKAELDGELLELLRRTLALSEQTGGALDPTVYPIVRLWGFTTEEYRVPEDAEIAQTLQTVGTAHVQMDGDLVTLTDGAMLDLGAVAKGYAAAQCAAYLERRRLCGILTLGGNVQTVGTKPDKSDWQVGIRNPFDSEKVIGALSLTGSNAVVTSGGYERYFERDGVRYHHIIDPATGRPADNELASVTVVCDDGFTADGLSTALFVMGLDKATDYWREHQDFEAVFITNSGMMFVTSGLAERISTNAPVEMIE